MQKLLSKKSLLPPNKHLRPFSCSTSTAGDSGNADSPAGGDHSGDVEKIYRILRRHHTDPSKLSLLLRPFPFRPSLVPRVLSRCGPAASLALPFLSWAALHPSFRPSPSLSKSLLSLLSKSRLFGPSWALLDLLRRRHPTLLSPDLFVPLIRRFAKSRLISKAIHVLDEMPQYGIQPDAHVFGCLLDALAKNGAVKEAANLFEEMTDKFPPNLRNYTSLLHGWCKAGKLEEAKFVLVKMKAAGFEPDVVVYNTLLAGFTSLGKMEDGYQLLSEMRRKKGCEPNAISYTTLIQGFCSRERMDEAMRVFVEMRRNGCEADVVTYSTLIGGFCNVGKIDRALEFLDAMGKLRCWPDSSSFFPIFVALEKREDLEQCLELMGRMSKEKCSPDLGVYNTVIRLACKLGELKKAGELWNEMEGSGLSPGVDTFVIMVHGFLHQGCLVEACGYFKEMAGRGLLTAPQYGTLKELLNALLREEKLELAKEVWEVIVSKGGELNVCAWTIWIHALFAKKHVKEACSYCIDMMEAGLMPQADTFAKLMKGLKKLYNRAIAAEITEKVRKMAEERNVSFKMYKRRGVMDLERKAKEKREGKKGRGRRRRTHQDQGRGRGQGRASTLSYLSEDSADP